MFLFTLLGAVLGAAIGAAVGLLPGSEHSLALWAPAMTIIGAGLGWIRSWILRQSGDAPKMRAALPLSGAVLSSLICVVADEPFLIPVVASLVLALALSRGARHTLSA